MRLIDVDRLYQILESKSSYGYISSLDLVNIPTVEAIPIEWIEKWFSQFYGEQGLEWNRCKRFMLKDWEKENETNRCR